MTRIRYAPYDDGPDPLAAPYDVRRALDALGDRVLAGEQPSDSLRDLLHNGPEGRRGLDELRREAQRRRKEVRRRGRTDGTLDEVRSLIDTAIGTERAELFPDPDDDARFREARLDAVPAETARAIADLREYDWRSPEAAQTFAEAEDLLRREVLDSRFAGMKEALDGATAEDMTRIKDMLAELNGMLAADERGELTQDQFDEFMSRYGDFFPDEPANLDELVDSLARRMAAAQRVLDSLTPQQRAELAEAAASVFDDLGLSSEMSRLSDAIKARRPDLDWDSKGSGLTGSEALGLGDATSALQELSDLEELTTTLGQGYPGASLDDVDEDAVRRALGRGALDDLTELRKIQRELEEQGWLNRAGGRLELTPKAVRRIAQAALRKVFASLAAPRQGNHEIHSAGAAGELTGATRAWQFGDEQPIDVVRTLTNAVRRGGLPDGGRISLAVSDFEVSETERRGRAAVSVLIDMSYSMVLRDTWTQAKTTVLALHALVTGMYPNDAVQLIGFSRYAQELSATALATLEPDYVQGTNLQHALLLSGRFLEQHPGSERIVLIVTDGEPTAHLLRDGGVHFDWPPAPTTLELTYAQVDAMTRRGATINVFSLDDDRRLAAFCEEVARRSGGRVFYPDPERLGDFVVSDYLRLRTRTSRRRSA